MRWFRKITHVCQNCFFGNNTKGAYVKPFAWFRYLQVMYNKTQWHVYCDKRKRFQYWAKYKPCFVPRAWVVTHDYCLERLRLYEVHHDEEGRAFRSFQDLVKKIKKRGEIINV